MDTVRALTPEQLARAEQRLMHPAPGSKIQAAKEYGVDLTLLIEQLRLTPDQRVQKLEMVLTGLKKIRGAARRRST